MSSLKSLVSLLLATIILLTGHGLQLTLLPLRAGSLGFTETMVGLTATAYYVGFVAGCFIIPKIIATVGHIRMFAALLAIFSTALLALDLTESLFAWILLRFITGAAMCGAYTVIESWLTDATPATARGKVLAIYTFLVLGAMTVGQFLINLEPFETSKPFIFAGMLIAMAIVPVSLTRSLAPAPIPSTQLSFTLLYKRSHTAFAGGLISGIVMGTFWSLGALYALRSGHGTDFVPKFISAVILGGALAQYPIGFLSDRVDRRFVLAGLCLATAISSSLIPLYSSEAWLLAVGLIFGASANAIYAVALARAADSSDPSEFVTMGSSVLLLNAVGAAIAPLLIGQLMVQVGSEALFWGLATLSVVAGGYIMLQPKGSSGVTVEEQAPFVAAGYETVPASFDNDPRSPEESEADLEPVPEAPSYSESLESEPEGSEPREDQFEAAQSLLRDSEDGEPIHNALTDEDSSDTTDRR